MGIIAERIRLLRESKGLTGDALAAKAGVRPSTISLLENEERKDPHVSTLGAIAQALGTTTDYLLGLSDSPAGQTYEGVAAGNGDLQAVLISWPLLADEGRHVLAEMVQLLTKRQRQLLKTEEIL